ncbi:indole-3-glycerol phosphate synthase TrpC [Thalassomonas viridans]|uniref:Indole-3-glycerol phosphate synthase n=1 Tax=Thalassomonas viridans TaxID=137584 RepID=A0AAE9ZE61_9GAMM|nr:indole-3-glycerol phosphate synthase TrpC [Thalassomonas viridans]WDE08993.1 indole-3-glycerol phosphate synthase TrpC [Thalassomonas viridans]
MLENIVIYKRSEVADKAKQYQLTQILKEAEASTVHTSFRDALAKPGFSLIAEIKRKSPSKGVIRKNFNALELARSYQSAGASAISILADEHFFGVGVNYIKDVAASGHIQLPILYKEFVISEYQICEAAIVGASAVLLIVRILSDDELKRFIQLAHHLGLDALVETFTQEDVERALAAGARIVGINNRDLNTFKTNFAHTAQLKRDIPEDIITVTESGLHSHDDFTVMTEMGFDAALVGEAILKHDNVEHAIKGLLNNPL